MRQQPLRRPGPCEAPPGARGGVPNRYDVESHTRDEVTAVLPEWRALHRLVQPWSPFSAPEFLLRWCELFVPPGRERILAVRRRDSRELVGVVPLYEISVGVGRVRVRTLQLLGAVTEPYLNELPEVLIRPEEARSVLSAVIAWLGEHDDWDWVELTLGQEQPWLEHRWVTEAGLGPPLVLHKGVVPSVILDVQGITSPSALKRNLQESLRRTRNRIGRSAGQWALQCVENGDEAWNSALDTLVELHGARSRMQDVPAHRDIFLDSAQAQFLAALSTTDSEARMRIDMLVKDGTAVAALLSLSAGDKTWVSVSGLAPAYWSLGAVTLLQWEVIQRTARHGQRWVVFSTGVDTAKLRWSEEVRLSHSFILVHPRRGSRVRFAMFWALRSHLYLRREARRFAPVPASNGDHRGIGHQRRARWRPRHGTTSGAPDRAGEGA